MVANTGKKKYTKLSKKHTCGICFRAESLECLSGGIAMIEATSCGGVVIFRGKILVLYKNYRNKYEAGSYRKELWKQEKSLKKRLSER